MVELSVLEILDRYGSVGPDFLTWMCVRWLGEGVPPPPSEPGLQISFMGPVVLGSQTGEATKITFNGDDAPSAPEVQAALRQGKRMLRSKVVFTAQDASWQFTLDAETFDLKSIKLPVPKMPDLDEYMAMRVQATQHLSRMVEELFEAFLPIRLDPVVWKSEVESWVQTPG